MHRNVFFALIAACSLVAPALANPTITAGNHVLLPNTADQQFFILISPGPAGNDNNFGGPDFNEQTIQSVDLQLAIGDGSAGPIITGVELISAGMIFQPNNGGEIFFAGYTAPGRIIAQSTSTANGSILADGNLAKITISTVGILALPTEQNWLLSLTNPSLELPTGIGPDPTDPGPLGFGSVTLLNGSLSIAPVPEPATFVMAGFGMLAFGVVAVRRHRNKRAA